MSLSRACVRVCQLQPGVLASLNISRGPGKATAPQSRGFFSLSVGGGGKSQSKVLSSPEDGIAELQVLHIKPEFMDEYLKLAAEHIPRIVKDADIPTNLIGAWTTLIGTATNTATHLWEYKSYDCVSKTAEKLKEEKSWQEFSQAQRRCISASSSQIILPFTFFQFTTSRHETGRIYELRSYRIRPGSMIEWGQEWSKGVQYRQDEAVGGWFSQIGKLHNVHHLWAYKSLQDRSATRQDAWKFPGWDECVRRTVPLIREMESSILLPTLYSPLQ